LDQRSADEESLLSLFKSKSNRSDHEIDAVSSIALLGDIILYSASKRRLIEIHDSPRSARPKFKAVGSYPMGITIDYTFKAHPCDEEQARALVYKLRQRCLDLPFLEVGEIREFGEDEVDFRLLPRTSPDVWLFIQAARSFSPEPESASGYWIEPSKLIVFTTRPGAGAEPAFFGLGVYTDHVHEWDRSVDPPVFVKEIPTNFGDWSWSSFCKTQFASREECGGVRNFIRTHMTLIKVLDYAKELGILEKVNDGAEYWETRDLDKLVSEMSIINAAISAFSGKAGEKLVRDLLKDFEKDYPELGPIEEVREINKRRKRRKE
jgi:hypothetical protein